MPTETTTWAYDSSAVGAYGIGRLATMTDPTGSTTYAYERRGMPTTQTKVVGSSTYVTKSVYDGNGNETQRTLPSGRVLSYSYDYADRPSGVTGTLAGATTPYVSSATYLPFGPITRIAFGNGTVQQRSYDTRYQPAEISLTGTGRTLSDIAYTNNAAGFVTSETDRLNAGYNRGYTYGGKSTIALTGASTGSALWGNATYTDSNDEKLTTINFPTHPTLLAYNSANQPIRATNTATNTASAITYNANGDETAYGSAKYAYSALDFLANGDGLAYSYDGSGERTTATASSGKRVSLYDTSEELQSESGLANGSIAYDYIWLAGLPVAQSDIGGQTHWTATDHLGTPFLQTDTTGKAYWQADYEPYGSVFALRTPDAHQPLRFPGQEAEEFALGNPNGSSASFYNQARWYRSGLGRYTQSDALDFDTDSSSLYAYVGLNPVNYRDRTGYGVVGAVVGGFLGGAAGGIAGTLIGGGAGAGAGTFVLPVGGTIAVGLSGAAAGATIGVGAGVAGGAILGSNIQDAFGNIIFWARKPPADADDPNGAKAPGKPCEKEGFKSPKNGDRWVRNPNGRGYGWEDENGNVWMPTGQGGSAHGGPHWDVEFPGGGYENVRPGGRLS